MTVIDMDTVGIGLRSKKSSHRDRRGPSIFSAIEEAAEQSVSNKPGLGKRAELCWVAIMFP